VYNDVPTIVTTWLTIMPKIAIVILAFEMISTINLDAFAISGLSQTWPLEVKGSINLLKNLLLISAFLSLIIGTIVGLAQVKIKRLLAYSTISHVGFLLLALAINTEESLESLLFYLVQYSLTNLNTFFILLSFGYILKNSINYKGNTSDINLISELKGQFSTNPLLSLSLAVSLFSMAGIPPLIGFFAKAEVLYSATQNGYYFLSFVAILVSVISAYYYLQIIKVMHFDSNPSIQENTAIEGDSASNDLLLINNKSGTGQNLQSTPSTGGMDPNFFDHHLPPFASTNDSKLGPKGLNGERKVPSVQGGKINNVSGPIGQISNLHSFIIATLTLSLLLFILKPSILLNSIHLIALNIFYV
jgi:NADH:ubiquinone oxidoreductase subunit 2 (subunit N)